MKSLYNFKYISYTMTKIQQIKTFPTNKDMLRLRDTLSNLLLFFDGSLTSMTDIKIEGRLYKINLSIFEVGKNK